MQRRGYGLIELLFVFAIIFIVAAISFPVFVAVRRRADHNTCAENLHQLGLATTLYANDHEGWVPPATTDTEYYRQKGGAPFAEIDASPQLLRTAMAPYVKSEAVWFCPSDPWRKQNVLFLGQSHQKTSYRFFPITEGERNAWPPRMLIGRDPLSNKPPAAEDIPLFSDATGIPSRDSDPRFKDDEEARSNHPDDLVNAIRHDLSLVRRSAASWNGMGG